MSAAALLDALLGVGIRLGREGDALIADVLPGVDLAPYRDSITTHAPALLAELRLREAIVAAASAEPAHFNRDELDRLWTLWRGRNPERTTQVLQEAV
jgi:hypothetical protein